ncbi:nucleotidyltransferase family protein [Ectothiorhodospira marina]|uniref:CBS domain-containing protein n=1 Tax=Ectothiorhodospira marina TaxID=1396821 RepID=A0A1H7IBM0_9GAMM|nr:nucleotidyltransferase family protein [Ectothiorhodospira marina]SEK59262.1 CBS domain-containing protein [Ectothiorhodospira marina]
MQKISKYKVPPTCTVREAISVIDRGAAQIALVVDHDAHLLGTVTDGDIRRALLRGEGLETPIEEVMHRGFRSLPVTATEEDALNLMRHEVIHQIPVIDDTGRVVRLFLLEELIKPKKRPNPVVIMAGGKGERLKHLTSDCPKPMLPVGGKPILEIILEQCIKAGFREFYFSVNYLKEQIQDHFGNGESWQVNIQYIEEDKPLGTAGALSLLPAMPEHPLLVLNGDVLTRVDYGRLLHFHSEHEAAATLCVREHTTQIPYGVVRMDDVMVHAMEEKPVLSHYVNAGIYLLDPSLLKLVPSDQFFDMPQLLEKAMAQQYRVSAFPIHEYWLDIGLPETLDRAHQEWR